LGNWFGGRKTRRGFAPFLLLFTSIFSLTKKEGGKVLAILKKKKETIRALLVSFTKGEEGGEVQHGEEH